MGCSKPGWWDDQGDPAQFSPFPTTLCQPGEPTVLPA